MSKLGYTWYPKDWTNSESVFQLNLEQRGLYRELIDMAMLNDNKTIIKLSVWVRKYNISESELNKNLQFLIKLELIEINDKFLFIPSCESRLNLVRGGKKGGTKSKLPTKPSDKPTLKGDSNQIETETKVKEKETKVNKDIPTYKTFLAYALYQKQTLLEESVKFKYESWIANEWKDGNDKKITNWKSKLLNTIPFLKEKPKEEGGRKLTRFEV